MKTKIPHRGLQDIRTMSERISDAENPQRKYLSLAMLELEKSRRNKEKRCAAQRVANMDQRLADIAVEQNGLLAAAQAELRIDGAAIRSGRPAEAAGQADHSFQITY